MEPMQPSRDDVNAQIGRAIFSEDAALREFGLRYVTPLMRERWDAGMEALRAQGAMYEPLTLCTCITITGGAIADNPDCPVHHGKAR